MEKVLKSVVISLAFLECVLCVVDFTCTNERPPSHQIFVPEKNFCHVDRFAINEPTPQRTLVFNVDYAQKSEIGEIHFEPYTEGFDWTLTADDIRHILPEIFVTFPNLSRLTLSSNLSALNPDDFTHAMKLVSLSLKHSDLKIIRRNVFSRSEWNETLKNIDQNAYPLHKLQLLQLFQCNIRDIEPNSFYGLRSLESLILSENELTTIRRGMFAGMPSLRWINLEKNKISQIEYGALDLPALQQLDLPNNTLKRLRDDIFDQLPGLQNLRLGQNDMEHIGQSLYRLQNTVQILMQRNRISDIDLAAFSKLPKLLNLDLTHSGFTFATTEINDVQQRNSPLKYLHIGNNNLSDATELNKLRIFSNLQFLDISENSFTNINVGDNQTLKDIFPSLFIVSIAKNKMSCQSALAIKNELEAQKIYVGRSILSDQLNDDECKAEPILYL